MAISVVDIATPIAGTGTASTTTSITLTAGAVVGTHVLVAFNDALTGSSDDVLTCADDRGNTYSVIASKGQGSNQQVVAFLAPVTTALQVGDQITVTNTSQSEAKRNMVVKRLTGATATQDGSAVTDGNNAGNPAVLNHDPSTLNNSLAVAVFGINASAGTCTMDAPWDFEQVTSTAGSANKSLCVGTADTGLAPQDFDATLNPTTSGQPWVGLLFMIAQAVTGTSMVFVKTVTMGG